MENFKEENKQTYEEIQFYRKMLIETSKISKDWMKTLKTVIAVLSIVIICGFIVCGFVVNRYLAYAYTPDAIEQSNTNTNVNTNVNENK